VSRRRTRPVDYAGAAGRIDLASARKLGPRWVAQEKIDGALVRVHLDGRGCIERLFTRGGTELVASGRRSETPAEARARIARARAAACGKPLSPYRERQLEPRRLVEPGLVDDLVGAHVGWPGSVLVGELTAFTEAGNRVAACLGYRQVHLFDVIRAGDRYVAREPYHVRRDLLWRMQSEVECYGAREGWSRAHGGRARDLASGRFCEPKASGWRLTPIVPQVAASRVEELWADIERRDAEGIVLVNLDAPIGARRSKLKCKRTQTVDAVVISAGHPNIVLLDWGGRVFPQHTVKAPTLRRGDVVELVCDGFQEKSGLPRHSRVVRARADLIGGEP